MHTTKQKKYTLQTKLQHVANKKETVKKNCILQTKKLHAANCKQIKSKSTARAGRRKGLGPCLRVSRGSQLTRRGFYGKRFARVNNNKIKHKIK